MFVFNSVFKYFFTDFGYPLGPFLFLCFCFLKKLENKGSGRLEADIKKGSEKDMIFE